MSTYSATCDFSFLNDIFSELFPQVNRHTQLNILLKKWEDKQRRSKKYWNETFNHDGFLSEDIYNNVLYIINDKRKFFRLEYEMQNYIKKNSPISFSNINASYMYLNKTNNKNIDINEYSKRYKKLILAELDILNPVLIVVLDNSCNLIQNLLTDKRNSAMTTQIRYTRCQPIFCVFYGRQKTSFLLKWLNFIIYFTKEKCQ